MCVHLESNIIYILVTSLMIKLPIYNNSIGNTNTRLVPITIIT